MSTFMQKKENVERKWYVIDAEGKNLGRVATKAAHILRGKHKVTFTPHVDCGDYVIIVNASKVNLTFSFSSEITLDFFKLFSNSLTVILALFMFSDFA